MLINDFSIFQNSPQRATILVSIIITIFICSVMGSNENELFIEIEVFSPEISRVFDCFLYNGESHMLYLRLWALYPLVTKFIISVSKK